MARKKAGKRSRSRTASRRPGPKKKLTGKMKASLKELYSAAMARVEESDVAYVIGSGWERIQNVSGITADYAVTLYNRCVLLYNLLVDWWNDEYEFPWRIVAAVVAALLYVINPWDLIPDLIPVVGYIDDAFVVSLCLSLIRKTLLKYCKHYRLDPDDYDL